MIYVQLPCKKATTVLTITVTSHLKISAQISDVSSRTWPRPQSALRKPTKSSGPSPWLEVKSLETINIGN